MWGAAKQPSLQVGHSAVDVADDRPIKLEQMLPSNLTIRRVKIYCGVPCRHIQVVPDKKRPRVEGAKDAHVCFAYRGKLCHIATVDLPERYKTLSIKGAIERHPVICMGRWRYKKTDGNNKA